MTGISQLFGNTFSALTRSGASKNYAKAIDPGLSKVSTDKVHLLKSKDGKQAFKSGYYAAQAERLSASSVPGSSLLRRRAERKTAAYDPATYTGGKPSNVGDGYKFAKFIGGKSYNA